MRACFGDLKAHLRRFLGEDSLETMIPEIIKKTIGNTRFLDHA